MKTNCEENIIFTELEMVKNEILAENSITDTHMNASL